MPLEILSVEGKDAAHWTELVNGLAPEHRDIHFLPEYGRIYRDCFGFTPFLAVYSDEEGYVLQSFVQRKLDGLPFLSGSSDANRFQRHRKSLRLRWSSLQGPNTRSGEATLFVLCRCICRMVSLTRHR